MNIPALSRSTATRQPDRKSTPRPATRVGRGDCGMCMLVREMRVVQQTENGSGWGLSKPHPP